MLKFDKLRIVKVVIRTGSSLGTRGVMIPFIPSFNESMYITMRIYHFLINLKREIKI